MGVQRRYLLYLWIWIQQRVYVDVVKMTEEIDEKLLEDLYAWVDTIPLSRPKKDIRRDFADGGESWIMNSFCPD